ncbi:MAG: RIO1 family regulatory kinase/ATPase [Nitrososphaerota archaeon]
MSILHLLRTVFTNLNEDHFKILHIIEKNLTKFEVVPLEVIEKQSKLDRPSIEKLLKKLNFYRLVWSPRGREKGCLLNYNGLDLLAIRNLVKRNIVESIGKALGVGKEADVYEALSPKGEKLAVKFFRIGRTSFRGYGKKRPTLYSIHSHLYASINAARNEFEALNLLHPEGVDVPEPIARNRHIVVTRIFAGIEIPSAQYIKNPLKILTKILDNVIKAYEIGVVHSDLSVYNILVKPSEDIIIIDWPQWVKKDHPMAKIYLKRDLTNLIRYFKKRWNIEIIPRKYQSFLDEVLGEMFNTA